MSRRTIRVIEMSLDPRSIARAIAEVQEVRQQLTDGMNDLIRKLSKDGEDIAKMQVVSMDAVDNGDLERSIYGYFDPMSRIGYVIAGAPHAIYVEYGTGMVGAENPHPEAGRASWEYDVNGHGLNGWVYVKGSDGVFSMDGAQFRWTKGYIARPFMYNTLRWLQEAAETTGADIILKNM